MMGGIVAAFLLLLFSVAVNGFEPDCPEETLTLEDHASDLREILTNRSLPFWAGTVDSVHGGYVLDVDARNPKAASTKIVISQCRMIWALSWAHNQGFSTGKMSYLDAAKSGVDFLESNFLDPLNGGYYFATDLEGNPTDRRKFLDGQLLVIHALSEYFTASGDARALESALDLFRLVMKKAVDKEDGGFLQDFEEDWTVIEGPLGSGPIGTHGLKTNAIMIHLLQTLTDLYEVSSDPDVREKLEVVLDDTSSQFFPSDPADSVQSTKFDGELHASGSNAHGFLVSFASERVRAEEVLNRPIEWKFFDTYISHAISHGVDSQAKGLLDGGELAWWPQMEFARAVATDKRLRNESEYETALLGVLQFFRCNMLDGDDGVSVWSVSSNGTVLNKEMAGPWKAGQIEIRGMGQFVLAYE